MTNPAKWMFLQEPAWKWFIAIGVMFLFLHVWWAVQKNMGMGD
jgi:hypothetical protein